MFFQSKKNYEPQRKLGHRKRVKVNELDKLMLAKIMLSVRMGRLLLPCRISKGPAISGVPASDTELCYRAEFFLGFFDRPK